MKSIVDVVIECSFSPVSCGWKKKLVQNPTQSKINHFGFQMWLTVSSSRSHREQ
jgi:hypothetical protein